MPGGVLASSRTTTRPWETWGPTLSGHLSPKDGLEYRLEKGKVLYWSKDGSDQKTYDTLEWLAAMGFHLPLKGDEQLVKYCGHYSNTARGERRKKEQEPSVPSLFDPDPGISSFQPPSPLFADPLDKGPLKHPQDSNPAQFPTRHVVSCFSLITTTPWDTLRHPESELLMVSELAGPGTGERRWSTGGPVFLMSGLFRDHQYYRTGRFRPHLCGPAP